MDDIPRYLACKHGEEKVSYLHPSLEPILQPTYGVMVYQEQVMQIAQVLGGYTLGSADLLRRAMGKKIKSEMDAQRALFTEGAIKNGVEPAVASQIFDQMAKFAGYGFNKSHSAPYALLAYQTAYLKANYPLEFFAATMTYDMHNTDKINVYRQDLERANIPLFPPDLNCSDVEYTVEGNAVRYALAAIKNVGAQAMETVILERKTNGPYKTLSDLAARLDPRAVNKRQLENLVAAGALDSIHKNRQQTFMAIDMILAQAQLTRQEKQNKQALLFGGGKGEGKTTAITVPSCDEWNMLEKLQKEFDALGFYLSAHPLDMYRDVLANLGLTKSQNLLGKASSTQTNVNLAGIILSKQERTSKTGQKFAFVSLSDADGVYEVAFFSETYAQIRDKLIPGKAVFVSAALRADGEGYRLTGQGLEFLDQKTQNQNIFLWADENLDVKALKTILASCSKGSAAVHIGIMISKLPRLRMILPDRYEITADHRSRLMSVSGIKSSEREDFKRY